MVPVWGAKILHAVWCSQKEKKEDKEEEETCKGDSERSERGRSKGKVMEPQHNPKIKPMCNPKPRTAAAAAKSLQLCPTLCDPRDGSPPGFAIPGVLPARTPEWAAISFSSARK